MNLAQPRFPGRAPRSLALLGVSILCLSPLFAQTGIRLDLVGTSGGRTTAVVDAPDGSDRLFIVKQTGQILVLEDGQVVSPAFLDISDQVACCESEQGMTSLAFHPDYEDNGRFFVGYVAKDLRTVVARFRVSNDPRRAVEASEREILSWEKLDINHHGGILAFGPDGYLYVANGEGGARNEAANLESFPGTILRIDVDRGATYKVPRDNPFRGSEGVLPEIWAHGVRNPWRLTFDRQTGDLFFGDVGASRVEEINFAPAESAGGLNFGWPIKEGTICLRSDEECADESLVDPIVAYPHDDTDTQCNSVTGGYFYRGEAMPTLSDTYVYGDFCTGQIWGARRNSADRWVANQLLDTGLLITSFGEGEGGELYVGNYLGEVYRVIGQPLFASDFESGDLADWSARRGDVNVASPGLRNSESALEVPLGSRSFVRSDEPTGEKTFRTSFDLSVNRAEIGDGPVEILRLAGNRRTGHVRLVLEKEGNRYFVNLLARRADGAFENFGRTRVPARRKIKLALDWLQASAPEAADGEVLLLKGSKVRVAATGLDNGRQVVRSLTLGLASGGGGSGSILFDNYTSSP